MWNQEKQIEALRGLRAANENEMSDMHVSFRKYANERIGAGMNSSLRRHRINQPKIPQGIISASLNSEFRINELKSEKLKLSEEITLCQYSLR